MRLFRTFNTIPIVYILIIVVEKFLYIINPIDWRLLYIPLITYIIAFNRCKGVHYAFEKAIFFYIIVSVCCCINAVINDYIDSWIAIRNYSLLIGTCLLYKPLCCLVSKQSLKAFESTIIFSGIIVCTILLLQGIFNINILTIGVGSREGFRSILGDNLIRFSSLLTLDRFFFTKNREKMLYGILTALMIYAIIYIGQSRSAIFAYLVSASLYIYFHKYHYSFKIFFRKGFYPLFLLAGGLIISILLYEYIIDIVNASIALEESSSIKRQLSYQYYWGLFMDNFIFGIGLIENVLNKASYDGVINMLFKNDIGIVGFLAEFGIMGFIAFIILLIQILQTLSLIKNLKYSIICMQFFMLILFNFPLNVCDILIYFIFFLVCVSVYMNNEITKQSIT